MSFGARSFLRFAQHPGPGMSLTIRTVPGIPGTGDEGMWLVRSSTNTWGARCLVADWPRPCVTVGSTLYKPEGILAGWCVFRAASSAIWHDGAQWVLSWGTPGTTPLDSETWYVVVFPDRTDESGRAIPQGAGEGGPELAVTWTWRRWCRGAIQNSPLGTYTRTFDGATGTRTVGNPYWTRNGVRYVASTVYPEDNGVFSVGTIRRVQAGNGWFWVLGGARSGEVWATSGFALEQDMVLLPCVWSGSDLLPDSGDREPVTLEWGGWQSGDGYRIAGMEYAADAAVWR